jgi:MerR family transcriptional regulator/heat shock protein HspR
MRTSERDREARHPVKPAPKKAADEGEVSDRATEDARAVYSAAIASQLLGFAPRTLRAYERLYSKQDLRWLRCIGEMMHEEGYTLRSIRRLLDFAPCWDIRRCPPEVASKCARALRIPNMAGAIAEVEAEVLPQVPTPTKAARKSGEPLVHVRVIYGLQELGTVMHCSRCVHAERAVRRVALEFGPQVEVTVHDILSEEARKFGVLMTPAIVIDDEVVSIAKAPSDAKLRELIERHLAAKLR